MDSIAVSCDFFHLFQNAHYPVDWNLGPISTAAINLIDRLNKYIV